MNSANAMIESRSARTPSASRRDDNRLVFFYGARETIWPGIVQSLMAEGGIIESTLRRCDRSVQANLGWSMLQPSSSNNHFPEHQCEVILTASQIAITEAWWERGIYPDAISARCGGEFAAAYARGALSIDDAMCYSCRIGHLIYEGRAGGHILMAQSSIEKLEVLQAKCPVVFYILADDPGEGNLIACSNGNLNPLSQFLAQQAVVHTVLPPKSAYHCCEVECWKEELMMPLTGDTPSVPLTRAYSPAGGGMIDQSVPVLEHLWRIVRYPVFIRPVLGEMMSLGYNIFLEVGGHPCCEPMFRSIAHDLDVDIVCACSMRRGIAFSTLESSNRGLLTRGCDQRKKRS